MITYYRTGSYRYEITPVPATSATDKTVTLAESGEGWNRQRAGRAKLRSSYYSYWKTEEEAKAHLRERAERAIAGAKKIISEATQALANLA